MKTTAKIVTAEPVDAPELEQPTGNPCIPQFAAIYARIATRSDQPGTNPLEQQIATCQQYCQQHGYTVEEAHIYQDIAGGGNFHNRPALTALCLAASKHAFDVVVIVSHDRLSRDVLRVAALLEGLDTVGTRVELVHEPPDAQDHFLHLLHTFQIEDQRERLKLAKHYAHARTSNALSLSPEEAALLRTLFHSAADGTDLAALTALLTSGEAPFTQFVNTLVGYFEQEALHATAKRHR